MPRVRNVKMIDESVGTLSPAPEPHPAYGVYGIDNSLRLPVDSHSSVTSAATLYAASQTLPNSSASSFGKGTKRKRSLNDDQCYTPPNVACSEAHYYAKYDISSDDGFESDIEDCDLEDVSIRTSSISSFVRNRKKLKYSLTSRGEHLLTTIHEKHEEEVNELLSPVTSKSTADINIIADNETYVIQYNVDSNELVTCRTAEVDSVEEENESMVIEYDPGEIELFLKSENSLTDAVHDNHIICKSDGPCDITYPAEDASRNTDDKSRNDIFSDLYLSSSDDDCSCCSDSDDDSSTSDSEDSDSDTDSDSSDSSESETCDTSNGESSDYETSDQSESEHITSEDELECDRSCPCNKGYDTRISPIKRMSGFHVSQPLHLKLLEHRLLRRANRVRYRCCEKGCKDIWRRRTRRDVIKDYDESNLHLDHFSWGSWSPSEPECPDSCLCKDGESLKVKDIERTPKFRVIEPLYNRVLKMQLMRSSNLRRYECCEKMCCLYDWETVDTRQLKKDYHKSNMAVCRYSWGDWKPSSVYRRNGRRPY